MDGSSHSISPNESTELSSETDRLIALLLRASYDIGSIR